MNSPKKALKVNPDFSQLSEETLLKTMQEGTANARQLAATALAARLPTKPSLMDAILALIQRPDNQQAVVMGVFTVSMIGVMALLENGDAASYSRLKPVISALPAVQRTDVVDYLQLATQINYEPLVMAG